MNIAGTLGKLPQAATRGFHLNVVKSTATIVAGSFLTSLISGKAQSMLPVLGSNKFAKVGTTLLSAGLVGMLGKKVLPSRANELFVGGMISGVTEGLGEFFPSIKTGLKGLADYDLQDELAGSQAAILSGMGDFANPMTITNAPQLMAGMNDFLDPNDLRRTVGTHGVGDFMDVGDMRHVVGVGEIVGEELTM